MTDDDDITRKRLANHDAQLVHILGIDGMPGRLAVLEADVRELQVDIGGKLHAEKVARIAADEAAAKRLDDLDVRQRANDLFNHEIKLTVRNTTAIVAGALIVLFEGVPKLIALFQHLH